MMKDLQDLFKHSAIYGLANILSKAVGFLMIPVYTRFIPPQDYGILELLDVSVNVAGMFVGMGITSALARHYYLHKDENDRKVLISSALLFLIATLGLFAFCGWYLADTISTLLFNTDQYTLFVKIILLTLACNMTLEIPLTFLRAMQKSGTFSSIAVIRLVIALSLNILFVVGYEMGIFGILLSGIITAAAFAIVLVGWTISRVGIVFDWRKQKALIGFGAPLILHRLGMFVINWGDRYFLNISAGLAQVGTYALGYKFGIMISFLIGQPFFMIWSVRRYELITEPSGPERYGKIFFIYFQVLIVAWLALSLFSREIVVLMADNRYHQAHKVIPLVALGYVFRECADFFNGMLYIKERTRRLGLITLLVGIYCLANYLILIPAFQTMGAAAATLSTFFFMAVITFSSANQLQKINYRLPRCLLSLTAAIAVLFCGYALAMIFSGPMLWGSKIVLCGIFLTTSLKYFTNHQERTDILQFLKKKLPKMGTTP